MNTPDPIVPTYSGRCHKRASAAKYLGMCVASFDKIRHQIPCSPIIPDSVVMVYRECDLDNWRLQQMGYTHLTQDMAALINSL